MTETDAQLKRYQTLMKNALDGIHIMDIGGNIVEVNDAFCNMLGYTQEEAKKLNIADWDSYYPKEILLAMLKDLVGKSARFETMHRCKDGTHINVEISSTGVDIDGQTYFFASSRDITERKKQERSLTLAKFTLDHAQDAIFRLNRNAQILYVNDAACKHLQYSKDELLKLTIFDINAGFSREVWDNHWNNLTNKSWMQFETTHKRKDGTMVPVEVVANCINLDGEFIFFSFVRNITERKQSEDLAQQFGNLLHSSFNEIFIFDAEHLNFIQASDGAQRNLGYSLDELKQLTPVDIKPLFTQESFERMIAPLRSGEEPLLLFETIHQRKDGTTYPVETRLQLLQQQGTHFLAIVQDITERKMAEVEFLAARQAEEASRAKSAFLSSMSHELRTPLNAILGFGQLLEMNTDSSTPEQRELIKYILTAGHQLLGLVNELLDLARIETGALQLNMQPLCIADLAASCVVQVVAAMANKKGVVIENTLTDPALWVQGDDLRLRQVLINLLSNAVKYNKERGRVTIHGVIEPEGRLRIEVRDTGMGIASDKLPLLFSPFERLDQRHGTISGVGIGLHITKQLVESMHGTVGVASEPGKGSTFWFELPLAEAAARPAVAPERTAPPVSPVQSRFVVLYIEDNSLNVKMVEIALQRLAGVELLTAGTAEEGLTIAEENIPDLILMDMQLPGIDGVTATTILKGVDTTKDIPVVALSANAMQEDVDRALKAGCCTYLAKPIKLQALHEVINRVRQAK
jgi:PAS domain S-box-containing protein